MNEALQPTDANFALTKVASSLSFAAEALERMATAKHHTHDQPAPRRGLTRTESAIFVGLSATTFDAMVKAGTMPKPIRVGTRTIWDIRTLDAAFDQLAAPEELNAWDE